MGIDAEVVIFAIVTFVFDEEFIFLKFVRYHGFLMTIIVMNVIPCLNKDNSEADYRDLFLKEFPRSRMSVGFWERPLVN